MKNLQAYQFRGIRNFVQAVEHLFFVGRICQVSAKNYAATRDNFGEITIENDIRPINKVGWQRKEHVLEQIVKVVFSSQIVAVQLRRTVALLSDDLHKTQIRSKPALGGLSIHVLAVLDLADQLLQLVLIERVRIVQRLVDDHLYGVLVVQKIFLIELTKLSCIRSLAKQTRPIESFRLVQLAEVVDTC